MIRDIVVEKKRKVLLKSLYEATIISVELTSTENSFSMLNAFFAVNNIALNSLGLHLVDEFRKKLNDPQEVQIVFDDYNKETMKFFNSYFQDLIPQSSAVKIIGKKEDLDIMKKVMISFLEHINELTKEGNYIDVNMKEMESKIDFYLDIEKREQREQSLKNLLNHNVQEVNKKKKI